MIRITLRRTVVQEAIERSIKNKAVVDHAMMHSTWTDNCTCF